MKAEDAKRLIKFLVEDGNPLWATALCTERNFVCPNDWYALRDKLEEKGMWHEFEDWVFKLYIRSFKRDKATPPFTLWLTRLTNDKGEPHFCQLVADYLQTLEGK